MIIKSVPKQYKKHQSFSNFFTSKGVDNLARQRDRAIQTINMAIKDQTLSVEQTLVLESTLSELLNSDSESKSRDFIITPFIAAEMEALESSMVINYLYHRYRYDVYPKKYLIDKYPPFIQIEPTSICNFRCIFCFQTDETFSNKSTGYMGNMLFETYKRIVDQIENNVEFISLASRGEPLICREIDKMLEYSAGKFLNLKLNTNASLLTEKYAHAILSGGAQTLVISADAAEEPLYSQYRVNGSLDKIIENLETFQRIKEQHYPHSKLITRVSGVHVNEDEQNMDSMIDFWGSLVDQVSFVKYNPWENTYKTKPNNINKPCSDLWRRMFIWYDGVINPCDSDYKSTLAVGDINKHTIEELWNGEKYSELREKHQNSNRQSLEPCRRCPVI